MFNIFKKKQQVKIHEEVEKPIEYFYYEPLEMAWYIVKYCLERNIEINMLKLQKLLYYVHVALLVESDGLTSVKTEFTSTEYGAYNDAVFTAYRKYSAESITSLPVKERYEIVDGYFTKVKIPYSIKFKGCDKILIDEVLNSYKDYSTFGIAKKTRTEHPFKVTNRGDVIEECVLISYFKKNKDKIYGKVSA